MLISLQFAVENVVIGGLDALYLIDLAKCL